LGAGADLAAGDPQGCRQSPRGGVLPESDDFAASRRALRDAFVAELWGGLERAYTLAPPPQADPVAYDDIASAAWRNRDIDQALAADRPLSSSAI